MKKKILVKGAYGESNFGDDLLMLTVEKYIYSFSNEFELTFTSPYKNNYCNKLLTNSKFIDINEIRDDKFDFLIYGGGTQFFDFGRSYINKILKVIIENPKLIYQLLCKIRNNQRNFINTKKTIALALGVGPFVKKRKNYKAFVKDTSTWDLIGVRDSVSKDYCDEINLDNVYLGADLCYSKHFKEVINTCNNKKKTSGDKKNIGVIVRDWNHDKAGNQYYQNLINIVKRKDLNCNFTMIIFAKNRDYEWQKIISDEGFNSLIWDANTNSPISFLEQLNVFDGFVSARYHGAIIASIFDKPVICIEVEDKLKILSEQIPEFKLWKKPFLESELVDSFSIFTNNFSCKESVCNLEKKADNFLEIAENMLLNE